MIDDDMKRIVDEHDINRVLAEYCLRLEISAFDEWLDLFTEDAVYEVFRQSLKGRAEISAMLSQAPHGIHLPGATRIILNGDSAEVIQSYMFLPTSNDEWNSGWYQRTLVRTSHGWKIAHTKVKIARTGVLDENAKAKMLQFPVAF